MSLLDYEFTMLTWIGASGEGFAWLIRGALILVGMGLVSHKPNRQQGQKQTQPAQQGAVS